MKKFVLTSIVGAALLAGPVAGADAAVGDQTLRDGMNHSDVSELQEWLNENGHEAGSVDGVFGPNTKSAVKSLQSSEGLSVDGIAGNNTFGAMDLEASAASNSSASAEKVAGASTTEASQSTGFVNPANGPVSSEYGPRGGGMHHGIDVASGGQSNVAVKSSASGTVKQATTMSGYGNTVIVEHTVNGQTFETLYAHLDSINVSAGDSVGQGESIGIMGNTGQSTGTHLHFEIHEGAWNGAKSNAVDPRNYVSF
ncbi:peptidoglycan DD-metalloendopeptidase family protein [Sinobaca sp. H24]|uniref:peptidoglycan DD-metalloendopeptidase family protein n=1 Tax=Sinobaca sp. H24 TaxID=2923376 RepID=UPI0020798E93|nr:peptidoglycan DD-metalloendopeptidase family protein [Sinobaca sp. H24]